MIRQNIIVENLVTINSNIVSCYKKNIQFQIKRKSKFYMSINIHAIIDSHIYKLNDSLNKMKLNSSINDF